MVLTILDEGKTIRHIVILQNMLDTGKSNNISNDRSHLITLPFKYHSLYAHYNIHGNLTRRNDGTSRVPCVTLQK